MTGPPDRFRDPRATTDHFVGLVLVSCPGCARAARVVRAPGDTAAGGPILRSPRRLVCGGCGLSRRWDGHLGRLSPGAAQPAKDPYFGQPLWLQVQTRHGWLWAYNLEHLDLLRHFVQATLRERATWYDTRQRMTLVARLPAWLKRARNREEILRAIARMPPAPAIA
ncbi:hypothetical protein RM844_14150 [Streptomyces sp. DSM 44915]|uniref:TFIIB-type zinc ribbon-containing protein n=1 Tax=Streptomyces chisholmiae TaxID=3075540 RepID=A0ABU2JRS9_9ACTN|nr:hypothetical protein [Streptomyces sp. DSM 44915]MDT0267429.1 hypothetical protein [Streptomyces sp. DSM 44915]